MGDLQWGLGGMAWMLLAPCPDLLYWPSAHIAQLLGCWWLKAHNSPFLQTIVLGEPGAALPSRFSQVGTKLWDSLCSLCKVWSLTLAESRFSLSREISSSPWPASHTPVLLRATLHESCTQESLCQALSWGNPDKDSHQSTRCGVGIPCNLLENVPMSERLFNFLLFAQVPGVT